MKSELFWFLPSPHPWHRGPHLSPFTFTPRWIWRLLCEDLCLAQASRYRGQCLCLCLGFNSLSRANTCMEWLVYSLSYKPSGVVVILLAVQPVSSLAPKPLAIQPPEVMLHSSVTVSAKGLLAIHCPILPQDRLLAPSCPCLARTPPFPLHLPRCTR